MWQPCIFAQWNPFTALVLVICVNCYLRQRRFPGRSLCCIENIAFVVFAAVAVVLERFPFQTVDLYVLDNHAAR
jgi:hypothetical protein